MRKNRAIKDKERRSFFQGFSKKEIISILFATAVFLSVSAFVQQIILPYALKKVSGALGAYNGMTQGLSEGRGAGKEEGLSAKDTKVQIENKMESMGKLQVLLVDMKLFDVYEQGDIYAALWEISGEGVFTVDLSQGKVIGNEEDGKIKIEIPRPEFVPYLNDSTLETVDDYNNNTIFNGDAKDGYTGYLNSRAELDKRIKKEFAEDLDLTAQAEASAKEQVKKLANSVCGSAQVEVCFVEEE